MNAIQLANLAHQLADRYAIADIEGEAVPTTGEDGHRWWDTRPMLDAREHSHEVVDMLGQAVEYAIARRLVARHPQHAHLVRINRSPE